MEAFEAVGPRPPKKQVPGEKQNLPLIPPHAALTQQGRPQAWASLLARPGSPKPRCIKGGKALCTDAEAEFDDR